MRIRQPQLSFQEWKGDNSKFLVVVHVVSVFVETGRGWEGLSTRTQTWITKDRKKSGKIQRGDYGQNRFPLVEERRNAKPLIYAANVYE